MTPEELEVRTDYRNTFTTIAGKKVLGHMLVELGFFSTASSEEEVALQNYAKVLLSHLGIIQPNNVSRVTKALLDVPVGGEEQNTEKENQ